jgi:steroid delta-isomerase-like uncharacterized protein
MTVQTQSPAEVARAIFDALGKKQLDDAMAYVDEDAVDDFVAVGRFEGKVAIRRFFDELLTAFPNFEMVVERSIGDDASAAIQWKASGDFTGGPFQGVEPTGKHVEIRGVDVMEIIDGTVRQNTIYYDGATFAREVGMLPRAGTTMDRAVLSAFNAATRLRKRFGQNRSSTPNEPSGR